MEDMPVSCSLSEELFNSDHALRDHQRTVHAAAVSNRRRTVDAEPEGDEQETAA